MGQVSNPSPQQSLQYGYLNFVRGLDRITTSGSVVSESTALFTFFSAYMLFLARWARKLSWKETAESFRTTWDKVHEAVEYAVA